MVGEAAVTGWQLRRAARCVSRGGVIAYPTEAVYGLGCDPANERAVGRLLALKQRPVGKGLILVAANFAQLRPWLGEIAEAPLARALVSWPGPATWVLPAAAGTPSWLSGSRPGLAVRVTDHPVARSLCLACGSALVSTSANPSRRPPARSALQVRRYFGDRIDCIVHGPLGTLSRPTPVRDAVSGRTLRA